MFGLTPYGKNQNLSRQHDPWDFGGFMEDFFKDSAFPAFYGGRDIKVDIREDEKEYIVEAELPGANKDEINIDLHNDQLTISVQKNEQVNEEQNNYIRRERRSSSLSRSFYIENVMEENVNAKFENGLLTIVLPKREPGTEGRRKIQID